MRYSRIQVGVFSFALALCGTSMTADASDGVFSCPEGQVAQAIDIKAERFTCVDLAALRQMVEAQRELIATLQSTVADLQSRLGCMSKTGDDVYFTGCNVHVRSGLGGTGPNVNGLGNLIVGYNEDATTIPTNPPLEPSVRTGSHNIIVGAGHSYTDRGGLVVGVANKITARFATITGGFKNTASGAYANVSGGSNNVASGSFSSVRAGTNNTASGNSSSVSGGSNNVASGEFASVSGGFQNTASGSATSVSGGGENTASGFGASVSGGQLNVASGPQSSSVSGGFRNTASEHFATVSGGSERNAPNFASWAAGSLFEAF